MSQRARLHLRLVPAAAVLAAGLAGCGATPATPADPTAAVPADAALYMQAQLEPQSTLKRDSTRDLAHLGIHGDPFHILYSALDFSERGASPPPRRLRSWLGNDAGLFIERLPTSAWNEPRALLAAVRRALDGQLFSSAEAARGYSGALVLESRDQRAARAFIAAQSAHLGPMKRGLDGVTVTAMSNGEAAAATAHYLIAGSSEAVAAAIEAEHGKGSLRHDGAFAKMRASAPGEALARLFLRLPETSGGEEGEGEGAGGTGASATAGSTTTAGTSTTAKTSASASAAGGAGKARGASAASTTGSATTATTASAKTVGPPGFQAQALPAWTRRLIGAPASTLLISLYPARGSMRVLIDRRPPAAPAPPSTSESEQSVATQQGVEALPESSWVAGGAENLPDALHKSIVALRALLGAEALFGGFGALTPLAQAIGRQLGGESRTSAAAAAGAKSVAAGATTATARSARKPSGRAAPRAAATRRAAATVQPESPVRFSALITALAGAAGSYSSFIAPLAALVSKLEARGGELHEALAGWMGPATLFISGASLLELNAGIVILSRNEARSRAAVDRLATLLQRAGTSVKPLPGSGAESALAVTVSGFPMQIVLADSGNHFIVGLGSAPIQAALAAGGHLGSSAIYHSAATELGDGLQPSLIVSFPQLTAFLGLLGANSNPTLAPLLPALYSLSTLTVGSGRLSTFTRTVLRLNFTD